MEEFYSFFEEKLKDKIQSIRNLFVKAGIGIKVWENEDSIVIMNIAIYNKNINSCQEELRGITYILPSFISNFQEGLKWEKLRVKEYIKDYYFILEDLKKEEFYLYYAPIFGAESKNFYGLVFFITYENLEKKYLNIINNRILKDFTILVKENYAEIISGLYLNRYVKSILYMLNGYDTYTYFHSMRVADFSRIIANKVGLNDELVYIAGLIHDLGKLWIPKEILYKKGKLTEEEFRIVKAHPQRLEEIFWGNYQLEKYVKIAKYHHEKLDGTGYLGLKGDEIPKESKILVIADIVDAMLNDRPYRSALSLEIVIKELKALANKGKIDKEITNKTIPLIANYYIGSMGISRKLGLAVSKSVTIHYVIKGEDRPINAVIENVSKNVITISVPDNIRLPVGYKVFVEYMLGGDLKRTKGVVIGKTSKALSIKITEEVEKERTIRIFWRVDVGVAPVPFFPNNDYSYINMKKILQKSRINAYTKVIGGDFLSFIVSKENDIFHLGDSVLIEMSPLYEEILITGIITHKVSEFEDHVEYWVEYAKLPEKTYSKIYRAIFRRQIEMKLGLKQWTK